MKHNSILKVLLVFLLSILFMFAGCGDISNNPEGSSGGNFLFLEYGMYTEGEFKEGTMGFSIISCGGVYDFDKENYCIRLLMPDRVQIDKTDKFIFGKYYNIEYSSRYVLNSGKITESLTTQKSFYKVDTLIGRFSEKRYEVKMIDCGSSGEAKVLFNNKEITLKPNETLHDTLTYQDVTLNDTYHLNFLRDIVVIKNVGFIKKTAIVNY